MHGDFVKSAESEPKHCCQLCGKEFISVEGLHYHETNQHKDTVDKPKRKRRVTTSDAQNLDVSLKKIPVRSGAGTLLGLYHHYQFSVDGLYLRLNIQLAAE